jgi:hypothetical protein
MTDRLDLANAIEAAGIEKAAEHIAATICEAIREPFETPPYGRSSGVATKADLAELRAHIDVVEPRLSARLGGLAAVPWGLLFAALLRCPETVSVGQRRVMYQKQKKRAGCARR